MRKNLIPRGAPLPVLFAAFLASALTVLATTYGGFVFHSPGKRQ